MTTSIVLVDSDRWQDEDNNYGSLLCDCVVDHCQNPSSWL